jgi:hypothetical protein
MAVNTGTPNTILLQGDLGNRFEEDRAVAIITPGMLIEKDLNNKVQPHSVRGGYGEIRVALEDGKIGKTIDNDYAVDDLVPNHLGRPGDSYYNLLHAGESVTPADYLISYGDGTLAKAAAGFLANAVADSTTVTNTVAETTFSTGTAAVPKNTLKVRDLIRVRALVVFPSTNGTDTATLKLKFAGSTILTTAAVDVANNDIGLIDATIVIRTIGAAGTFDAFGTYGCPRYSGRARVELGFNGYRHDGRSDRHSDNHLVGCQRGQPSDSP